MTGMPDKSLAEPTMLLRSCVCSLLEHPCPFQGLSLSTLRDVSGCLSQQHCVVPCQPHPLGDFIFQGRFVSIQRYCSGSGQIQKRCHLPSLPFEQPVKVQYFARYYRPAGCQFGNAGASCSAFWSTLVALAGYCWPLARQEITHACEFGKHALSVSCLTAVHGAGAEEPRGIPRRCPGRGTQCRSGRRLRT